MKYVKRIETRDGLLHKTEEDAERHADKVYGLALSKLAHEIVNIEKYSLLLDYLDRNLPKFLELSELQEDTKLNETPISQDNE